MQDNIPTTPISLSGQVPPPHDGVDADWLELEGSLRTALAPRYLLLRRIGAGGMGAVYLAREPELGRLVAVKVLTPQLARDETARARFMREAQSAASIAHPNVVAIHSIGALDDGTPYFVMQYATGESIASRLTREGPVSAAEARRMIGELASALAAAHSRGIVHRDVKPANVLYDQETGRVLITDFGIAAVLGTPGEAVLPSLTRTGMMIGTPQYMSPEQAAAVPASDKSDVYGLGLVAYELLTGAGPFEATSPMLLMAAHLRDTPRRISERRADVDPEIEDLVLACLAKDPAERPSAADIVRRLGAADVVLEWPAPGLSPLHSALPSVVRPLAAGAGLTGGSFLVLFGSDPQATAPGVPLLVVALLASMALGVLFLSVALLRVAGVARAAQRAVRMGYGWTTIAETFADSRRDAGLLIAGLREYTALTPVERDTMRRRRVIAAMATLVAGGAPVPMVVVFTWLAALGTLPGWLAPLAVFGPTLALLAIAVTLERSEDRRLRHARGRVARRRSVGDATAELVESWRTSFDSARSGQRLAAGPVGWAVVARPAAMLLTVATLGMIVCLVPIFYIGIAGSSLWPRMAKFEVQTKLQFAETARPLVLPGDPSISALDAGRAVDLLLLPPGERLVAARGFVEQPAVGPVALLPDWFPPALFVRPVRDSNGKLIDMRKSPINGPNPAGVLRYAAGGLTPDERRWLEELDGSPRWEFWRQFVRAQRSDYFGARFVTPFADSASAFDLPILRFAELKATAYAAIARAALYRSRGEQARGDTALREIVTFGFRLVDNANSLIEELIGIVIVGIGHDALNAATELDGRPPGAEWLARRKLVAAYESRSEDSLRPVALADLDPVSMRRHVLASVTGPSVTRSVRVENYSYLTVVPCTNVRELLSGSAADVRAAMVRGRAALARFPSEQALFDLLERIPETTMPAPDDTAPQYRLMVAVARLSGWILRNPRVPGCAALVGSRLFI